MKKIHEKFLLMHPYLAVQLVCPFIYLTQVLEQKIQILIKTIQMVLNVPAATAWEYWGIILVEKEEIAFSF